MLVHDQRPRHHLLSVFFAALILFLLLLRVVNSPFGRVLQAIRENEFRAEALGYRTVVYRSIGNCLAAAAAALAGVLCALWLRYTGPAVTLSFDIMLDILLMVVIGGMGTLYGAVLGAAIFVLAETYLQNVMAMIEPATAGLPLLPASVPSRPLAALARRSVRAQRLFLSVRHRRPAASASMMFPHHPASNHWPRTRPIRQGHPK